MILASMVSYVVILVASGVILGRFLDGERASNVASLLASAVSGFATVYSGAAVAPRRNRLTLNVLAGACGVLFGASALLFAAMGHGLQAAQRILLLVGIGVAAAIQVWLFPPKEES